VVIFQKNHSIGVLEHRLGQPTLPVWRVWFHQLMTNSDGGSVGAASCHGQQPD
jgi:hypothetical protein